MRIYLDSIESLNFNFFRWDDNKFKYMIIFLNVNLYIYSETSLAKHSIEGGIVLICGEN